MRATCETSYLSFTADSGVRGQPKPEQSSRMFQGLSAQMQVTSLAERNVCWMGIAWKEIETLARFTVYARAASRNVGFQMRLRMCAPLARCCPRIIRAKFPSLNFYLENEVLRVHSVRTAIAYTPSCRYACTCTPYDCLALISRTLEG